MKLDLGCGLTKHEGALGVELQALPGVDIVHDLNQFPYPFENDSIEEIWMTDLIEHLDNTIKVMEEIHRILKPGGLVHIKVVHWTHHHAYADPTHVKFLDEGVWDFFSGEKRPYYTSAHFMLVSKSYKYDTTVKMFIPFKPILEFLSYFLNNIKESVLVTLKKPI